MVHAREKPMDSAKKALGDSVTFTSIMELAVLGRPPDTISVALSWAPLKK